MNQEHRDRVKELLHMVSAVVSAMDTSLQTLPDNLWKYGGCFQYASTYNDLVQRAACLLPNEDLPVTLYNLERAPTVVYQVFLPHKQCFESVYMNLLLLRAYLESKLGLKADEIANLRDFLQANLRRAVLRVPKKERDVQDVLEQVLIGRSLSKGLDYDRETGRVKTSIKEAVPDFIFPRLSLALEVKLSKDKPKSRAIVDEINADIKAYGKAYANILFVVYDLGTIADEAQFRRDLEASDNVAVIVVKH